MREFGQIFLSRTCLRELLFGAKVVDLLDQLRRYRRQRRTHAHAADHEDPEFHKYHDWVQPLVEPPYAAFNCSLGHAYFSGFSLGGLATNEKAQVLNAAGEAIPGLYAAGACATNIAKDGMGYSSGTCVGESTFFGRQAGIDAARA